MPKADLMATVPAIPCSDPNMVPNQTTAATIKIPIMCAIIAGPIPTPIPRAPSRKFVMMIEKPAQIMNKSQKPTVRSFLGTMSTPLCSSPGVSWLMSTFSHLLGVSPLAPLLTNLPGVRRSLNIYGTYTFHRNPPGAIRLYLPLHRTPPDVGLNHYPARVEGTVRAALCRSSVSQSSHVIGTPLVRP